MRLGNGRTVRRGLALALVIVLCAGATLSPGNAQETAPLTGPTVIASGSQLVLLRERPGYDAAVLAPLSDGAALEVIGAPETAGDGTSWLPVVAGGQSGYVPAGYVVAGSVPSAPAAAAPAVAPDPAAAAPAAAPNPADPVPAMGTAVTTSEANLRAGPGVEFNVLGVLPPGALLSVDGVAENGFIPVTGNGVSGWVAVDLVSGAGAPGVPAPLPAPVTAENANPAPATVPAPESSAPPSGTQRVSGLPPPASSGESTGIAWPFAGGEWEVVQGYNGGTHQNRGGFSQYHYSLDWARVDGNSAGQPVFAPVSGTVQWTDRGSGGVLIDAGNGFGVALFHVTLDGSAARGGTVARGQPIGTISGPGGDGYMSMAHIEIAAWRLYDGGHESVPFTGPNAIAGMEFPDNGGSNQHMGATVTL